MQIRIDKDEFMPQVDFGLICISSSLKEYRLAYTINRDLRLNLVRDTDVNFTEDGQNLPLYARYVHEDELAHRNIVLYCNRPLLRSEVTRPGDLFSTEETNLLLAELPKADYLLQFNGGYSNKELDEMKECLHELPGVSIAFIADPSKIKNIDPILI
jgi:hypothetical protein